MALTLLISSAALVSVWLLKPMETGRYSQDEVPSIPGRARDALYYLDLMDRVTEISPDNLDDFRQQLADYDAETAQLAGANWLTQFDSVLTQLLTPALSHAGDAFVRKALQHRMAALAIGIRL